MFTSFNIILCVYKSVKYQALEAGLLLTVFVSCLPTRSLTAKRFSETNYYCKTRKGAIIY